MSTRLTLLALGGMLVVASCTETGTSDDEETTDEVEVTTPISVTIPPERTTPFCTALIELNDRLLTDPEVDADALILETYQAIVTDAPDEIADDFRAVLTELETGVPAPTLPPITQPPRTASTDPETGETVAPPPDDTTEYFFPAPTSRQRVNDYVEFACRDSINNPGPPATSPDAADPDDTDTDDDG